MNQRTVTRILALGAVTGMRSMSGLASLAFARRSLARPLLGLAAAGEMVADKTSLVGDRTAPMPLAGRAVMGAAVGALIAREQDQSALLGVLLGATTAVCAAHLAYQARRRLPLSSASGGLLEDTLVLAIASRYA